MRNSLTIHGMIKKKKSHNISSPNRENSMILYKFINIILRSNLREKKKKHNNNTQPPPPSASILRSSIDTCFFFFFFLKENTKKS